MVTVHVKASCGVSDSCRAPWLSALLALLGLRLQLDGGLIEADWLTVPTSWEAFEWTLWLAGQSGSTPPLAPPRRLSIIDPVWRETVVWFPRWHVLTFTATLSCCQAPQTDPSNAATAQKNEPESSLRRRYEEMIGRGIRRRCQWRSLRSEEQSRDEEVILEIFKLDNCSSLMDL